MELVRSGGLAGVTLVASMELAELDSDQAAQAESALAAVDWTAPQLPSAWRDGRQYDLTLTLGDSQQRVVLGEDQLPAALRPLLDELVARGRLQP